MAMTKKEEKSRIADEVGLNNLLARFMCFIGFHKWKYYGSKNHLATSGGIRICQRCYKKQAWLRSNISGEYWFYNF